MLLGASRFLGGRGHDEESSAPSGKALPAKQSKSAANPVDDELADIEAILRKHNIK